MCVVCGRQAVDGMTHPNCLKAQTIDGCFIAYEYSGPIKKLLYIFKYQPYVYDVHHMLGELFYEAVIQKERVMYVLGKQACIFVPIPLHTKKMKHRGYNHAKLLTQQLAQRLTIPAADVLIRKKETYIQAGLSKEQRKQNMKDAFAVKNDINGKTVILIDDIVTTGVTFLEAAKVLKKSGVRKVYGLAFSGEN